MKSKDAKKVKKDSGEKEIKNLQQQIEALSKEKDELFEKLQRVAADEAVDGVVKGVRMVFEHMLDALKACGLEQINAVGQEFDPIVHEAVQLRAEADKPDNVVLEEFQTGYKLNGQVVRPSKVIVNKLPVEDKEAQTEAGQAAVGEEAPDQTTDQNATVEEE